MAIKGKTLNQHKLNRTWFSILVVITFIVVGLLLTFTIKFGRAFWQGLPPFDANMRLVTIENDTNNTALIANCASQNGKSTISPDTIAHFYIAKNVSKNGCSVYLNGSNKYTGCVVVPSSDSSNASYKISSLRADIPAQDCGNTEAL